MFVLTELLCRLFIKDKNNVKSPEVRRAYGTLASVTGIVLNIILAAGKFTVGTIFGAISLQADGINNISDAGSQIISLISFKMSSKPADREHPFGHARIEYVASMIVSIIVLLIGCNLFSESVGKIFDGGSKATFSWIMIIVLSVSVLVKLWLCMFNRKLSKKINSAVMKATAVDSLSDAAATFAVLCAMLIFKFTGADIDAYMGAAVAVIIMIAGIKILNEAKNSILGERPSPETVEAIKSIVSEYGDALGMHDLVVHNYGPGRIIATMHVEVDGSKDIFVSHDMIDTIEKRLNSQLGIQSTIHMDPIVTNDELVDGMKKKMRELVKSVDTRLDIHDFRFVHGNTHTNLIFDVSAPYEVGYTDEQIKDMIDQKVKELDPSYFVVITIDRS